MTFYTQLFTSKRGPLAKIWLAAHWERKLTKAHVFECNLETTISDIISPMVVIGLRTSGHLLIGVVRIYSRKAKYLLTDCSDALVKIKMAFRPDQTDMPVEGLEATLKSITLMEDFTSFDAQVPDIRSSRDPRNTALADHYSLNQSRTEEITLKEDFGNNFLKIIDFGDESQNHHTGLLDISFQSLIHHDDTFGDEDEGYDLIEFLSSSDQVDISPLEPQHEIPVSADASEQVADKFVAESPRLNGTILLPNEREAFALEPVLFTPNLKRKRGKRKRKLVVDQTKELTDVFIKQQLSNWSDLVAPMDMAPPTLQLMLWKEKGGADKLSSQPCSSVIAPQIKELFAKSVFHVKHYGVCIEVETMRQETEGQRDIKTLTSSSISIVDSSTDLEQSGNIEPLVFDHMNNNHKNSSLLTQDGNRFEVTHPELPSEDSMFVHPSIIEKETLSNSLHTQSMLDSQDFEEKNISLRAQKLLDSLKRNSDATFSLEALCEGRTRIQAAATFLCLLVLKKEKALHLHQSAPYKDIIATPGPKYYAH